MATTVVDMATDGIVATDDTDEVVVVTMGLCPWSLTRYEPAVLTPLRMGSANWRRVVELDPPALMRSWCSSWRRVSPASCRAVAVEAEDVEAAGSKVDGGRAPPRHAAGSAASLDTLPGIVLTRASLTVELAGVMEELLIGIFEGGRDQPRLVSRPGDGSGTRYHCTRPSSNEGQRHPLPFYTVRRATRDGACARWA